MDNSSEFVRTTIYLQRRLHESVKMMAIYTNTSMSHFMRIALKEKIEKLKGERGDKTKNDNI